MSTTIPIQDDKDQIRFIDEKDLSQNTTISTINPNSINENTPLLPIITPLPDQQQTVLYDLLIQSRNILAFTLIILLFTFVITETTQWPLTIIHEMADSQTTTDMVIQAHNPSVPLGLLGQRPWS